LSRREFAAPWWLRNPHLQTIYASIAGRVPALLPLRLASRNRHVSRR